MPDEPLIQINGVTLTEAQAMTVRVACGAYLIDLGNPDALGDDDHGRHMVERYTASLCEIFALFERKF